MTKEKNKKLTEHELYLISRHLKFYKDLESGKRTPTTEAQIHFVAACKNEATPETEHEIAYIKYRDVYGRTKGNYRMSDGKSEWGKTLNQIKEALENNKIKPQKGSTRYNNPKKKPTMGKYISNTSHNYSEVNKLGDQKCKSDVYTKQKENSKVTKKIRKELSDEEYMKALNGLADKRKKEEKLKWQTLNKMAKNRRKIPDYEEGYPKPGWFTDEDWKKMRRQDYADMKKHHRD
jgi:uncharacterized protein YifE (UPF0438 family)